jgi:RimJ/RimL family protein N-acetyltransferase
MSSTIGFAEKPTLTGQRVILRPITVADAPDTMTLLADPETARLTGTQRTFTLEQVEALFATLVERTNRLDLAVIEADTGRYAGEIALNDLDTDNLSCSFRVALIDARSTGRGLGTEATTLILGHAFDTVGLHRVELEVYAFNPRARHVYEKIGFVYEGTKRQALRWQGEWIDTQVMAMLADDWSARRAWSATDRRSPAQPGGHR